MAVVQTPTASVVVMVVTIFRNGTAPLSASVPPPSYPCLLIQGCCTRAAVVCCCTVPRVLPLKTAVPALLQSAAAPMPERVLWSAAALSNARPQSTPVFQLFPLGSAENRAEQMHAYPHQCFNHFRWGQRSNGPYH